MAHPEKRVGHSGFAEIVRKTLGAVNGLQQKHVANYLSVLSFVQAATQQHSAIAPSIEIHGDGVGAESTDGETSLWLILPD